LADYLTRRSLFALIFVICFFSNGVASLYFGYVVSKQAATDAFKIQVRQSVLLGKSEIQEGNYGRYVSSTKRFFSSIGEDVGIWLYSSIDKSDIIAVNLVELQYCREDAFSEVVRIGAYYQFCHNVNGIVIQVNKRIKSLSLFNADPLQLTVSLFSAIACSVLLVFLMRSYFAKLLRDISSFFTSPSSAKLDSDFIWLERPIKQLYSTIESLRQKLNEKEKSELLAKSIRQVVHDLAAPLSGLDVLASKLKATHSEFAPISQSILLRLKSLVDDLRDQSSIKVEIIESFDIYAVLEKAFVNIKAQHSNINLSLIIPNYVVTLVYGNKNHFVRIVECLIQNSVEASFPNRPLVVVLTVAETDIAVNLSIRDNGKGINDEYLRLVTLSGVSIGKTLVESSGSGLGLSFAFEKTEEWGGSATIMCL